MSVHIRTTSVDPHNNTPVWLRIIHAVNEMEPETFGRPEVIEAEEPRLGLLCTEVYPDARVLHRDDGTVSLVSRTAKGERLLRAAAASVGFEGWLP